MFPSMTLMGGRPPVRQIMASGPSSGGFVGATPTTSYVYGTSRVITETPEGNHIAVMILSWRNGATPRSLSFNSFGGGASWTIATQGAGAANGCGIALTHRQLTATEITNLLITGSGAATFSGPVVGLRTAVFVLDRMLVAGLSQTAIVAGVSAGLTLSATLPNYVHEGSYIGVAGSSGALDAANLDLLFPAVEVATSDNTANHSAITGQVPFAKSAQSRVMTMSKASSPSVMALAAFAVR